MTLPLFTGGAAVERPGVCRICGRTLKNPESARIGIGPVCAGKASSSSTQEDSMHRANNVRAKYEVLGFDGDAVWIADIGEDTDRSVTNDAEAVVQSLANRYGTRRIIYKDTMGRFDELVHERGVFKSFAPGYKDLTPPNGIEVEQ